MSNDWNFFHKDAETKVEDLNEVKLSQQMRDHGKKVMEALLFSSSEPIPLVKFREILQPFCPLTPRQLKELLEELRQDYISQQRSFHLEEIAQGFLLRTHPEYAPYIETLHRNRRGEKLSHAGCEVLAIVAHRQPITRSQIDAIRGVDSSGTLSLLIERQLVESIGRLEAPGRPLLYGTTSSFLQHFGLKNLDQLVSNEATTKS